MNREKVYKVIDSERDYQDEMIRNEFRPEMIEDLHLGDTLSAMQHNLNKALEAWYKTSKPHTEAMAHIRKICALGVQISEKHGMPVRSHDKKHEFNFYMEELECPYDFGPKCTMGRCDCKPKLKVEDENKI